MPRTIEGIVQNHKVARELRAAGKPIWSDRINIKDLFDSDDDSNENTIQVATEVAKRFKQAFPNKFNATHDDYDHQIDDLVDHLEDMHLLEYGKDCAVDEFNGILDEIYDWADYNRVWIG